MKSKGTPEQEGLASAVTHPPNRWLPWLVRLLLSAFLLGLVLRSVDASLFWTTVCSADIKLLALSIALFYPGQMVAAYRWSYLLRQLERSLPFWSIARHNMLGQFSALFLPGQVSGDVVRAIAVAHGKREKATFALSVAIDKVAFLCAMVSFVLFGALWSRELSRLVTIRIAALAVLLPGLLILIFLCRYRSDHIPRELLRISDRLPFVRPHMLSVAEWLHLPRLSWRTILVLLGMAFGLQLSHTVGGYILTKSLDLGLGLVDWAAANAAVSIVQALPFSIGGLGVREGAFAAVLALYDVPVAQATAFSLLGFALGACLTSVGWFVLDSVHRSALRSTDAGDRGRGDQSQEVNDG